MKKPEKDEWGSALEAFESALKLEKFNNESLLSLHNVASEANDATVSKAFKMSAIDTSKIWYHQSLPNFFSLF